MLMYLAVTFQVSSMQTTFPYRPLVCWGQVSTCGEARGWDMEKHHEVLDDVGLQLVQVGLLLPSLRQADQQRQRHFLFLLILLLSHKT